MHQAEDGLEEDAGRAGGLGELPREAVERGEVHMVPNGARREIEQGVAGALGIGVFERSGPRPAQPLELEPSGADGAADVSPSGGAHLGASAVSSRGEEGDAEGVGVVGYGAPGFESPASGGGVAGAASGVKVNEADGGEGPPAGPGSESKGGELSELAEGCEGDASDLGAVDEEFGGTASKGGARETANAGTSGAAARESLSARAVAGGTTTAACDCVDTKDGGAGAGFASSGAEGGANAASKERAVGDDGGLGRGEGNALLDLDVVDEEVRGVSEATVDLPASGGTRGGVEIVDVDLDLAVELVREGVDDVIDGVG